MAGIPAEADAGKDIEFSGMRGEITKIEGDVNEHEESDDEVIDVIEASVSTDACDPEDADASPATDGGETEPAAPEYAYLCKMCRLTTCLTENVIHCCEASGRNVFSEPIAWMQDSIYSDPKQGKLLCACKAKLGNYSWVGVKCACGEWISPAFQIHSSKVDQMVKTDAISRGVEPLAIY